MLFIGKDKNKALLHYLVNESGPMIITPRQANESKCIEDQGTIMEVTFAL